MHICFLTSEYPPLPCGGIGTSIRNLGRALVEAGCRVSVLGLGGPAEFHDGEVAVRMVRRAHLPKLGWLQNRLWLQRELRRMVRCEQLDLVEAPDWCGLSAGIRPGCPVVIRCNGSAVFFGDMLGEPVRFSVRLAETMALRQADSVVAVSRFAADRTQALFGLQRSIQVIPNGLDVRQFVPNGASAAEPTILYFSTVVRKKGVFDLALAFNTVAEHLPDAQLLIIGRDSRDSRTGSASSWKLVEASFTARARRRVTYLGPLPYDQLASHVAHASVCVFPSYAETQGLAWAEAMACAKPVVAYDIGWAPEVVVHGETGLLVHPGSIQELSDAIVSLLESPGRATAFGVAGRRRVKERFSAEVVARANLAWYESVIHACHK